MVEEIGGDFGGFWEIGGSSGGFGGGDGGFTWGVVLCFGVGGGMKELWVVLFRSQCFRQRRNTR